MLSLVEFPRSSEGTVALARELALLNTLAHLGWMDTAQLHAICFAGYTRTVVRATLRGMTEAGWVDPIRWRIHKATRYSPWAISLKGLDMIARYRSVGIQRVPHDLARPSTAVEITEWQVQCAIRHLLVQLILEARQKPMLAALDIQVPGWPPDSLPYVLTIADATLSIRWTPAQQHPMDWSPWSAVPVPMDQAHTYKVHIQRPEGMQLLRWLAATTADDPTCIPVILVQNPEDVQRLVPQVHDVVGAQPVRISTWNALDTGIVSQGWKDAQGRPCSLQLQPDEVFPC